MRAIEAVLRVRAQRWRGLYKAAKCGVKPFETAGEARRREALRDVRIVVKVFLKTSRAIILSRLSDHKLISSCECLVALRCISSIPA